MKIAKLLRSIGFTSDVMHSLGLGSIVGALALWGRSAGRSGYESQARAERLALFVGMWAPTFFQLGKVLQDLEHTPEEQVQLANGHGVSARAHAA